MSRRGRIGILLAHGSMALIFAVSVGCSLPYVYPKVSSIDSLDLVRLSNEVHAFRIDADGWIKDSAVEMAARWGAELLDEEGYRALQAIGEFDTTTSSWIKTPATIRQLGGALFCDRRYETVFVYHNGAESYYSARGFRCALKI